MAQQHNYDESKVPNYQLPELLKTADGQPIQSVKDWENIQRKAILQVFEAEVYGHWPEEKAKLEFITKNEEINALAGKAIRKEVTVRISTAKGSLDVDILLFLPKTKNKIPVFLGYNFFGNHSIHPDPEITLSQSWMRNSKDFAITENKATEASRGVRASRWPVEEIIERGYGLATIYYGDIDPDFDDDFQNGIQPLFYKEGQSRPAAQEWGYIAGWAYALSRAMDYLETDARIHAKQVIVIGHSRLGKTSLYAGALDERFSVVISNNSGCGGAALSRRQFGETVKVINDRFPHWFCDNFKKYNDKEETLPIDQHMLIALMAPRPVYVASASEDQWADPKGEFLSAFHASKVYELYGLQGLGINSLPAVNTPSIEGHIGYHLRAGKHDLTSYDWNNYMDFADRHFKK